MSCSSTRALKGALWIEAAILLILISILADSNAWIGAIAVSIGFLFAVVGIVAAHRQHIGFLYCYVTLVGLWEITALAHILIICGLIVLPHSQVNLAYIVGQKVLNNPSDPMKIVIPMLYGLQWGTWCITLVCLVSLRVSKRDPVVALEVQDSKELQSHEARRNQGGFGDSSRMDQHLYNLRQSIISPHSGAAPGIGSPTRIRSIIDGQSTMRMQGGKDISARQHYNEPEVPHAPERTWIGMERRSSPDSNAIIFPSDSKISQVVVTFRDDARSISEQRKRSINPSEPSKSLQTEVQDGGIHAGEESLEACMRERQLSNESSRSRDSKDLYTIKLSPSGESLSDMIFKSPQDNIQQSKQKLGSNLVRPSECCEGLTLQYNRSKSDVSNPARVRATPTKASLTLSSDSSSSELSVASSSDYEDTDPDRVVLGNILKSTSEDSAIQEAIVAGLGLVHTTSLSMAVSDIIKSQAPEANSGSNKTSKSSDDIENGPYGAQGVPAFNQCNRSDESEGFPPQMQPNSSDSSPSLSSLSSASLRSRQDITDTKDHQRHIRNRSTLTESLGDMSTIDDSKPQSEKSLSGTDQKSSQESDMIVDTSPSSAFPSYHSTSALHNSHSFEILTSASASTVDTAIIPASKPKSSIVSFPLNYWRNRSSSSQGAESSESSTTSFSQSYIGTFSKKKKPVIPTIVIHPDEEEGGPPRVLSQKDIDYLSTTIPPKLRPMLQPWEEYLDDEEYDEGVMDDGYNYSDYHHGETFTDGIEGRDFNDDIDSENEYDDNEMESEEFDPYAFDSPVDIDEELNETKREQARVGYGYI